MDINFFQAESVMSFKYTKFFQVPFLEKVGNLSFSFNSQEKVFMQIKLFIKRCSN